MSKTLSLTSQESRQTSLPDPASALREGYRSSPSAATSMLDASYDAGVITISGFVLTYYAHQIALATALKHVADSSIVILDRISVRDQEKSTAQV